MAVKARQPVRRCLQQAASAAGVSVEITEYTPNAELHNDHLLAAAFRANAESLARRRESHPRIQAELKYLKIEFMRRTLRDPQQIGSMIRMARHPAVGLFLDQPPVKVPYGTDLGQVSQALPAIHPNDRHRPHGTQRIRPRELHQVLLLPRCLLAVLQL